MPKRPVIDPGQFAFTFDPPRAATMEADLAGLDRQVSAYVGVALKDDVRPREFVAAAMSMLLGEDVSRAMLDGYASEARDQFNISASRLLALIAVTERFDLLDKLTRRIGAALLVGDEMNTAQLGHIDRQIAELKARRAQVAAVAKPIGRESRA